MSFIKFPFEQLLFHYIIVLFVGDLDMSNSEAAETVKGAWWSRGASILHTDMHQGFTYFKKVGPNTLESCPEERTVIRYKRTFYSFRKDIFLFYVGHPPSAKSTEVDPHKYSYNL